MNLPKEIIDNSSDNTLITFLKNVLESNPQTKLDIATAFFNIQAYALLKENLDNITHFRLLLGSQPLMENTSTLGNELLKQMKSEIEHFELTEAKSSLVTDFINFLKQKNVEVRLFRSFLHGKAYIFDDVIVIGSSNFTHAGLTRYGELNTWKQESQAIYTKKEWFDKFWDEADNFKKELIELLEKSRFGSKEYTPYEIFIKSLYELQKDAIQEEDYKPHDGRPPSKVNLAQFQEDAIHRVISRLKKYNCALVADSVGLGKTWIAKKILEEIGYYQRSNILVICPAQLREMWKKELKNIDVKENIISQEELAAEDYLDKAKKALGNKFTTVKLIVVDESHNFRNPLTNRWENFFTLVNDHISEDSNKPYIIFMTATPINNTIWDLYWQIMLLTLMDRTAFIKENIPDLFTFFKDADNKQDPTLLNDLLNELSVRRTRNYIKDNYEEAYIMRELPDGKIVEQKVIFPERKLKNIYYELDASYKGMYREISDCICKSKNHEYDDTTRICLFCSYKNSSEKTTCTKCGKPLELNMAYYKILEYKKEKKLSIQEKLTLGRMIAIGGIFRTILLKRLESSVEAFRISISNHIKFLRNLLIFIDDKKLLRKESFRKYILFQDDQIDDDSFIKELESFPVEDYEIDRLKDDIKLDIEILQKVLERVNTISVKDDSKLNVLKKRLLELSKHGQIVLFSYYADTLNYIYNEIAESNDFSKLKIEAVSGSGMTSKTPIKREIIKERFINKEIDILMSTDVLSEGQNLQSAKYLVNYDLHWNPTRMIQRAGRIDRIGSPYKEIFIYNFFPENELEELLSLVSALQNKIQNIDKSIGLDQSILGEEIHPKVFGTIKRIQEGDETILDELELDTFGGGEIFYQPLKQYLKEKSIEELENMPSGIYSGLEKKELSGIFFYYKYDNDFHLWYYYDFVSNSLVKNKSEILDHICCTTDEKRIIPSFFEKIYEINKIVLQNIEEVYKEYEQSKNQDTAFKELSKNRGSKFIITLTQEMELQIFDYLYDFPDDTKHALLWDQVLRKLSLLKYTKKRLSEMRKMWKSYKQTGDWKLLIDNLNEYCKDKGLRESEDVKPFNINKLQLITIDFVS